MKARTKMMLGLVAATTYPALNILVPAGLLLALSYGMSINRKAGVFCGAIYALLIAYIMLLVNGKKRVLPIVVAVWLVIWLILLGRSSPETAYWRPASATVRPLTLWYMVLADEGSRVGSSLPRLSDPSLFFLDTAWGLVTVVLLWAGVKGCGAHAGGKIFAPLRIKNPAIRSDQNLAMWLPAEAPAHNDVPSPVDALIQDDAQSASGIGVDNTVDGTNSAVDHDDAEIAAGAPDRDDVESEEERQKQPEATMRLCARCKELKDQSAFRRQAARTDGLECWCIECEREYGRQRRRAAEQAKTAGKKDLRSQDRHRVVDGLRQKRCRKCKRWKPEDRFSPDRRNRDGLDGRCKQCKAQAERQYRKRRLAEAEYLARKALIAPAIPL